MMSEVFFRPARSGLLVLLTLWTFLALAGTAGAQEEGGEAPPPEPITIDDPLIETEVLALRQLPLTASELAIEADAWLGLLRDSNKQIANETIRLRDMEGDQADELRKRIAEMSAERDQIVRNFLETLSGWEKKGGAPEEVAALRQYHTAIFTEELRVTDFQTLLAKALAWVMDEDGGIKLGIQTAVIVGSFLLLLIAARFVRGIARRLFGRIPNLTMLLKSFLVAVVYWITLAFGLMVVLSFLGIDITPLFALVGGAAFIIAFAMQDTLANLAAGLMIMINRPFDVGDYVDTAGINGTIKGVSIASTTLVTPDNQIHIVPNSKVWGDIITNVTSSETRRIDLVFGIGYDDNIETAQKVLEELVASHPLTLDDPAPVIRVSELADNSVNFICRPWSKTSDYWTVYWDLTRQVKEAFDAAGVSIPYPQRDVHIHQIPAPKNASSSGVSSLSQGPRSDDMPPADRDDDETEGG
jgi:small conductance mechanosensitive channel